MSKNLFTLTRHQLIGALLLIGIIIGIFVGLHFLPPTTSDDSPVTDTTLCQQVKSDKKHYFDSIGRAKKHYYDSLHIVRRDSLHQVYEQFWDSIHHADSIWWDSVYQERNRLRPVKKDTILNLNTADTTELKWITGIGSATARKIIRYRERLGGFVSVQQLQDDEMYEDAYGHVIKDSYRVPDSVLIHFVIGTEEIRKININHATKKQLLTHPYLHYPLAQQLYDLHRRQHIRGIDDLRRIEGMTDDMLQKIALYLCFDCEK